MSIDKILQKKHLFLSVFIWKNYNHGKEIFQIGAGFKR